MKLNRDQIYFVGIAIIIIFFFTNKIDFYLRGKITKGNILYNYTWNNNGFKFRGSHTNPIVQFSTDKYIVTFSGETDLNYEMSDSVDVIYLKSNIKKAKIYSLGGFWFQGFYWGLIPFIIYTASIYSFLEPNVSFTFDRNKIFKFLRFKNKKRQTLSMKKILFLIVISINCLASFCQTDSIEFRIYNFINNIELNDLNSEAFLKENASPLSLLNDEDSLIFALDHCMFTNSRYFNVELLNKDLTDSDKKYMIEQIKKLNHFKWEQSKIKKSINFISVRKSKRYQKKSMRIWGKESNSKSNNLPIITIYRYSAPVFNKKHNIALVYISSFSGPLSGAWGIKIYMLIDNKWINIGYDPQGMS